MRNFQYLTLVLFGFLVLCLPLAYADAQTISVQAITPGTSVLADTKLQFIIVASGFTPQAYQLSDSFSESTASVSDITGDGNFSWVPIEADVGTHTFSIIATDNSGNTATTTQTITVEPAPSVSVGSVSPGLSIMSGTTFSFSVSTSGFTDPSFIVSDSFGGSTITDSDMSASGNFSWTPGNIDQDGGHIINVYAYDSLGHSASVNVTVQIGPGPSLSIQGLSPGTTVSTIQPLTFMADGSNFSPDTFSVSDNFPNSTLTNSDIDSSGSFRWFPETSDIGTHVLTITGTVGTYGQSATTTETIQVVGAPGMTAPVAASTLTHGVQFTTTLYSGMQGQNVTELQTLLSELGFFSQTPNGYFGPVTVAAVEKFQAAHGLAQIGVVGPATRAALNALSTSSQTIAGTATSTSGYMFENPVTFGQSGADVLQLQKRLAALGYLSAQPTGYFGYATLEALIQFQQAQGIPLVDQVGAATRAALNQ